MLIVGINGSPREGGNTARLVRHMLQKVSSLGAGTQYYSVAGKRIGFCTACEVCMREGFCPFKDDYAAIYERLIEADGVILGSPNYAFAMSGQVKVLFDRSHCLLYYMQMLGNKYGVGVAVGGDKFRTPLVAKTLAQGVWLCGGYNVGYTWAVSADRDEPILLNERGALAAADKTASRLYEAIRCRKRFWYQDMIRSVSLTKFLRGMVASKKRKYPFLHDFYVQKGWIKA